MRSLAAAAVLLAALPIHAEPAPLKVPCPEGVKTCKVIVLTDEQIKLLEILIDSTSANGPYKQINDSIAFFHKAFDDAPNGTPAEDKK